MDTKSRISQTSPDEFDDLASGFEMDSPKTRDSKEHNRRRDIEDLLEARRLQHEIEDFDSFEFK